MKVFSKEKYIEVQGMKDYMEDKDWVDEIDGRPLDRTYKDGDGMIDDYFIASEWLTDK
jgi:hypothetical protein